MKYKGYTLMELLVVITLLVLVMVGGTGLFLSNLRTGGTSEVILRTSKSARTLSEFIETKIRFGQVIKVDELTRDDCLLAGNTGVSGNSILLENLTGGSELISLSAGVLSSSSATLTNSIRLNNTDVSVESFDITWYCKSGINDKMNVNMVIKGTALGLKDDVTETISREIVLLNSGVK